MSDEHHIKDVIYFITSLNIQYIKYLKEKCLSRKYFSCLYSIIRYKLNVCNNICHTVAYKTVLLFTNSSLGNITTHKFVCRALKIEQ